MLVPPPSTLPCGISCTRPPSCSCGTRLMLGQVLRAAEDLAEAGRDLEDPVPVVAAGLEQQHARAMLGDEPPGGDAAGAAAADDDVVVGLPGHRPPQPAGGRGAVEAAEVADREDVALHAVALRRVAVVGRELRRMVAPHIAVEADLVELAEDRDEVGLAVVRERSRRSRRRCRGCRGHGRRGCGRGSARAGRGCRRPSRRSSRCRR